MENFLEMEKDYENIYVFYEINKNSDNIIWYYDDMPVYLSRLGKGSSVPPFEKDEFGNCYKIETLYPIEEQFSGKIDFKEESLKYLNKYFEDLLGKNIINRFVVNDTSKHPDL